MCSAGILVFFLCCAWSYTCVCVSGDISGNTKVERNDILSFSNLDAAQARPFLDVAWPCVPVMYIVFDTERYACLCDVSVLCVSVKYDIKYFDCVSVLSVLRILDEGILCMSFTKTWHRINHNTSVALICMCVCDQSCNVVISETSWKCFCAYYFLYVIGVCLCVYLWCVCIHICVLEGGEASWKAFDCRVPWCGGVRCQLCFVRVKRVSIQSAASAQGFKWGFTLFLASGGTRFPEGVPVIIMEVLPICKGFCAVWWVWLDRKSWRYDCDVLVFCAVPICMEVEWFSVRDVYGLSCESTWLWCFNFQKIRQKTLSFFGRLDAILTCVVKSSFPVSVKPLSV